MFRRGKRDEDEDDINALRGDFTADEDEIGDDDDAAVGFMSDVAPDDEEDSPKRGRRRQRGRGGVPGQVGVIGGAFRVIGIALVSALLFLLIGLGIALGAGALGAVDLIDLSAIRLPEIALLPTTAPVEPTTAGEPSAAVTADPDNVLPTPFPTATLDVPIIVVPTLAPCPDEMAAWWNGQAQVYESFRALSVETPPDTLLAMLQRMRVQRDAVRSAILTPCVDPARNAFVAGYDSVISAFEAVNAGNLEGARAVSLMAGQAFGQGLAQLWGQGVATDGSPVGTGIAYGSAGTCGAAAWYAAAQTERAAFLNAYWAVDPATMPGLMIRQNQDTMAGARGNVEALDAPTCAAEPSRLLLAYMDDMTRVLARRLGSNPAETESRVSAYNTLLLLDAWLYYLGLTP